MNELVTLRKDQAVTTSLKVAEIFHKRHDAVLRDIRSLDCSDEFRLHNFVESKYKNEQNHRQPMFYLTKDGFTFLVMGYRGKKAAKFKEAYISQFNRMESVLKEKITKDWLETRQQGKITRKAETDVIKELVEYAKTQGSTHSQMLYMTYSKLANRMVGIKGKERDIATTSQLNNLGIFENIILNLIRVGMSQDMDYHDIYRLCEGRCVQAKEIAMIG